MPAWNSPDPVRKSGGQVRRLFARIAPRYDLANRVLSLSVDRRWRRRAVRRLAPGSRDRVLDVFCGTGDLTGILARTGAEVVGADFCPEMIAVAVRKLARRNSGPGAGIRAAFVAADALSLPFPDESFDLVTAAFGVRNLEDLDRGLAEMVRVSRRGGRIGILEFGRPPSPWMERLYGIYLRRLLPRIGGWLTGDPPSYEYLSRSIPAFLDQAGLGRRMRAAGLDPVHCHDFTGGIAALHVGFRP